TVEEPGAAVRPTGRPAPQRWPWVLAGIVGVAVIAIAALLLWLNNQSAGPTVDLSATTALPGDAVIVTPTNLPAGQTVSIELESSAVELSRVQADRSGAFTRRVNIPGDATPGVHLISVCWNGSCPARKQLTVQQPPPSPTPTPSPTQTPTPTPTPTPSPSP